MNKETISKDDILKRIRWRSRRGVLENDLILTKFLDNYEKELTFDELNSYSELLELNDNDLMDLLLGKKEPAGELNNNQLKSLLKLIRENN
tara:strand:- start:681 stop:953 length:273 start_codon:yes stop_codon:yes gene_type:complete